MRKLILTAYVRMTVVATAMMLMPSCSDGNVKINEKNFPDESFRACLLEQDYGQDGQLTAQEIAGIERIDAEEMGICSLKGIEFFTSLKDLRCWGNQLTELDLSGCPGLKTLMCESNKLTELDLSGCPGLETLKCTNNQLTELDLAQCTELSHLQCEENKLEALNVRDATSWMHSSATTTASRGSNSPRTPGSCGYSSARTTGSANWTYRDARP